MPKLPFLQPQFLVYIAGGVLCALIDIGLMQLLIFNKISSLLATSAGFTAGLLVNFAFHAKVTFNKLATPVTFLRFMCLVGINYLITISLVGLSLALVANALIGKLVSLPVVAVNGYLLGKHWIFK
jgi:putative flippase GtrA